MQRTLKFGHYAYVQGKGPSGSTRFADDATLQVFGMSLPKDQAGEPVAFKELYDSPQQYGWIETSEKRPRTGALAVWPSTGGLVVADGSKGKTSNRNVQVLVLSNTDTGELSTTTADKVLPGQHPKYLIPEAWYVNAARSDANELINAKSKSSTKDKAAASK